MPEQIETIARETALRRAEVPEWRASEEAAVRGDIRDRVHARVQTVMEVEGMSPHERALYIIGIEDRVSEMAEMIATLLIDPLTGLNIRRYYEETVPRVIEEEMKKAQVVRELTELKEGAEVQTPEISMLMIDADYFKQVNDTYGHAAGDFVLREMGKIVHQIFRKRDIKARYGGEELVVVMPGCSLKVAREKAEQLRTAIAEHEFIFNPNQGRAPVKISPVTVSIGVGGLSLLEEQGNSDELKLKLEKRADALVYAAKELGRNRVVSQDAVDMEKLLERKKAADVQILPAAATAAAESATGESTGESASTAPGT